MRLKICPCATCGTRPVLEHWSSGGNKYAVRCNNPDRPDSCSDAFYYSLCSNPYEAVAKWNEYQSRKKTVGTAKEVCKI